MLQSIQNFIVNHIEFGTISIIGIVTYLYNHFKDRDRLKTTSKFFTCLPDNEHGCYAGISVKAVNNGKSPIVLTSLVVQYDTGAKGGIGLGYPKGLTLNEKEQYRESLEDGCTTMYNAEHDATAIDMWFEDTLGRKYPVKDVKLNLRKVWKIVKTCQKIANDELEERMRLQQATA